MEDKDKIGPKQPLEWSLAQRKEAFEIYFSQLSVTGTRDLKAIAEVMGVPIHIIKTWAKADKWEEKAAKREGIVDTKLEEQSVEKVGDIKLRYTKRLSDLLNEWFKFHVEDPEQLKLLLATTDVESMGKILKMLMIMLGEPTVVSRIEGNVTHTIDDAVKGMTTEQLRDAIAAASKPQRKLPQHDEAVDAEIVEPPKDEDGKEDK